MKPESLEKLLRQEIPPSPDAAARRAARHAALAEFARLHPASANEAAAPRRRGLQGLLAALRLSREPQSRGSDAMPWYARRMLLGGAASACLAVVGFALVWNTVRQDPKVVRLGPESEMYAAAATPASEVPAVDAATSAASSAEGEDAVPKADAALPGAMRPVEPAAAAKRRETLSVPAAEPASAEPPPPPPAADAAAQHEVTVTGMRQSPQASRPFAKTPVTVVDGLGGRQAELSEIVVTQSRGNAASASAPAERNKVANDSTSLRYAPPPAPPEYVGRDQFEHFDINPLKRVLEAPVSTFSADVDTASYSFVRRQLMAGVLPQKDAVRVEEMINYFSYSWPAADSRAQPFKPTVVVSDSPWGRGRKLVHIGIGGYRMHASEQPDSNLVLLLDVSGSMSSPDRLPLAIQAMELLLGSLKPTDTVSIVVYAGAAGTVLEPTEVRERQRIVDALNNLRAGGSTAGAEGIKLAYELAEARFRKGGVNRILLATDGDFNVGIDSTEELKGYVERQREKGIFLSVLGFGAGNYRDEMAQALAQNGNGVAAYIDSLAEARKVLVQQATGSLFTIAKDVKLQVEFNPDTVSEYRLVGYETRALKREDFNNDAVDAGDIGAGHTVTAIYEITPANSGASLLDERRYGAQQERAKPRGKSDEYGFLRIRYKLPDGQVSKLIEQPIRKQMPAASADIRRDVQFSTAVAGFGQLLRGGTYTGKLRYDDVIEDADAARGADPNGYRAEFVQLVRKARTARGM